MVKNEASYNCNKQLQARQQQKIKKIYHFQLITILRWSDLI